MQMYMCNVCGMLHSLFNDAALCHPDVITKEVEDLPTRAAEHRNEAEGEQDAVSDNIDERIVNAELKMFPWGKNDAS